MRKQIIIFLVAAIFFVFFFSFKLTDVPKGITVDEGAFGYNAVLLSKTLHDENGRFLPIFVLSIKGTDWRQPITQYFDAVFFKLFGASVFNLRFTSVIIAVFSVFLLFCLARYLFGTWGAITAALIMITTPIFMIQSHLGLDNIYPIPFVIGWLLSLFLFEKTKKNYWLILSAICLGVGFYSYKAMRVFVPTWSVLTFLYIAKEGVKKSVKSLYIFSLTLLPFFATIPILERFYSGAILDHTHYVFEGFYKLFYPYLSSFDFTFLFIKGDEFLIHSTGWHGMFLIASLPFFIVGLSYWKKSNFWKLIILAFFLGPLLFGIVGSIHRASRMLAEIPLYSLISAAGFLWFLEKRNKIIIGTLVLIFALNYFDFLHYYWGQYGPDIQNLFYDYSYWQGGYKMLKEESVKENLTPYIDVKYSIKGNTTADFMRSIYFVKPLNVWSGDIKDLPAGSVLMTDNTNVPLRKISSYKNFIYYTKN